MKPIKFAYQTVDRDKEIIRISKEHYNRIAEIAEITRQPMKVVADRLLAEALAHVELVETKLYNMEFKE